ncbi:MAG: hypothetical protein ACRDY1_02310 [Acidimicrobiales bacterium]
MDRLLRSLVRRALRRGVAGEPVWLAVALGVWLVRRARNSGPEVIWEGRVAPGQRLTVTTSAPGTPAGSRTGSGAPDKG